MAAFQQNQNTHIRPVDPRTDLPLIADLIERCFQDTMDPDGREYLRYVRRFASSAHFFSLTNPPPESFPLNGLVWVEDNRIIGNLTLIPFHYKQEKIYLIANVSVHPDYRRQGIARQLTQAALWRIAERGGQARLQVRDDNQGAYELYCSLGFQERTRRSTWVLDDPARAPVSAGTGASIHGRRREEWPQQLAWLERIYPPEVAWNLPYHPEKFKPDFFNQLSRLFGTETARHWSARQGNRLLGLITWEASRLSSDLLWLAVDETVEDEAVRALLPVPTRQISPRRPLTVNYPAGRAAQAFQENGFRLHNTLIWMEYAKLP